MAAGLRIVFLDSWRPSPHEGSGTAVGISTLARALERLGHEVTILRPEGSARGLPRELPGGLLGRILFNVRAPARLRAGPAPDLVVGFDVDGVRWGAARMNETRRASSPRPSRYVVALKGVAWDEARFARSSPERWLLSTLARVERTNARSADRVIVPSSYSAEVVHQAYDVPDEVIRVVPEPIDLTAWNELRSRARVSPEHPTILSVARQYPRKDTATLLRALPRVRDAVPGVRVRIIGGGPELPRLRALSEQLDLKQIVTFEGPVADDAVVRRAFLEAEIFCLPSRQEGFGIVFLEAMAAGLPVVAAQAGAVPEVVVDGRTGFLFPPGDERALADALLRLLHDRPMAERLGAEGTRRVARFDLEPVGRAFLAAAGLS